MIITIETVIRIERADGTSTQVTHESSYPAGDNLRYERSEVTAAADKHHAEVLVRLPIPPDCPEPVYEVPSCSAGHPVAGVQCSQNPGHAGEHRMGKFFWEDDSCEPASKKSPCSSERLGEQCRLKLGHSGEHRVGRLIWHGDLELPCNSSFKGYRCERAAKHVGPHLGSNRLGGSYLWDRDRRG